MWESSWPPHGKSLSPLDHPALCFKPCRSQQQLRPLPPLSALPACWPPLPLLRLSQRPHGAMTPWPTTLPPSATSRLSARTRACVPTRPAARLRVKTTGVVTSACNRRTLIRQIQPWRQQFRPRDQIATQRPNPALHLIPQFLNKVVGPQASPFVLAGQKAPNCVPAQRKPVLAFLPICVPVSLRRKPCACRSVKRWRSSGRLPRRTSPRRPQ